jgi:hypothetical protein
MNLTHINVGPIEGFSWWLNNKKNLQKNLVKKHKVTFHFHYKRDFYLL